MLGEIHNLLFVILGSSQPIVTPQLSGSPLVSTFCDIKAIRALTTGCAHSIVRAEFPEIESIYGLY
jgi:hypothetical protein